MPTETKVRGITTTGRGSNLRAANHIKVTPNSLRNLNNLVSAHIQESEIINDPEAITTDTTAITTEGGDQPPTAVTATAGPTRTTTGTTIKIGHSQKKDKITIRIRTNNNRIQTDHKVTNVDNGTNINNEVNVTRPQFGLRQTWTTSRWTPPSKIST